MKFKSLAKTGVIGIFLVLTCPLQANPAFANGSEVQTKKTKSTKIKIKRKQLPEDQKATVEKLFKYNESLHKSFFDYKPSEMEAGSKKLSLAIEKMSEGEVKKLLLFSSKKLKEISALKSREENNKAYHIFSTALVHVLKTYDIPGPYNAYYCPMVKKNWIQNSNVLAKTQNPYAPEMKMCGDKKTTF